MDTEKISNSTNDALIHGESSARSIDMRGHEIDSRSLFIDTREITIAHGDETYRLRLTSQNKLILTK